MNKNKETDVSSKKTWSAPKLNRLEIRYTESGASPDPFFEDGTYKTGS